MSLIHQTRPFGKTAPKLPFWKAPSFHEYKINMSHEFYSIKHNISIFQQNVALLDQSASLTSEPIMLWVKLFIYHLETNHSSFKYIFKYFEYMRWQRNCKLMCLWGGLLLLEVRCQLDSFAATLTALDCIVPTIQPTCCLVGCTGCMW